jgi:hypothetical protein
MNAPSTIAKPKGTHNGQTLLAILIILLLTAAFRVPLLSIPLDRDEGEYAYIAWRLEHHELPYRDWVDQKPPAVFWVYRAALSLPIEPVRAIHLMALVFSAGSACALFFLARRFANGVWGLLAGSLFAILSADPHVQGTSANTEVFMLLPLILSQWAFLYSGPANRRRGWLIFLVGALIGLASAFKQVAGLHWPFLVLLYPMFFGGEKRLRDTLRFCLWSALGVAVIWAGIAFYFYSQHGLPDLVYNVLTHNLEYINAIPGSERLKLCQSTLAALAPTQAPLWIFSAIGLIAVWRSGRSGLVILLAGWFIVSAAGVSASGYFFPHYFQQSLPVLCVMAALGAEAGARAHFLERFSAPARVVLMSLMLGLLPVVMIFPFLRMATPAEAAQKIYPRNLCPEMPLIARRLAEVTSAEDRVFVFGAEAEVLFYARRVSATRYIFLFPLYGPYHDAREKQEAVVQEISLQQPAALLFLPNGLFFAPGTEQFLTKWTQAYLRENFRGDLYIAMDDAGNGHLLPAVNGKPPPVPAGQRVLGGLFLRKPAQGMQ